MPAISDGCVVDNVMDERPLIQPYLEEVAAGSNATEGGSGKAAAVTETVLIVDDDEALRNLVTMGLRLRGYRTLTAANGLQALDVAERHSGRIDALLTDISMPYVGGKELARRLTAVRPRLKVLFMSGSACGEPAEVTTSGTVCLQKPFPPVQLWQKLRETFDHKDETFPATVDPW